MLGKLLGTIGGVVGGPVGSAIGGFVGGSIDGNKAKRTSETYYSDLSRRAKAGGFHPLEALRAGGGATYGTTGQYGSAVASANAFDLAEDLLVQQESQKHEEKMNAALKQVGVDTQKRGSTQSNEYVDDYTSELDPRYGRTKGPKPAPGYWAGDTIPVVTPMGDRVKLPKRLADRLGVKPFDAVIADDLEAIGGDELAQLGFADWFASNIYRFRLDDPTQGGSESTESGDLLPGPSYTQQQRIDRRRTFHMNR